MVRLKRIKRERHWWGMWLSAYRTLERHLARGRGLVCGGECRGDNSEMECSGMTGQRNLRLGHVVAVALRLGGGMSGLQQTTEVKTSKGSTWVRSKHWAFHLGAESTTKQSGMEWLEDQGKFLVLDDETQGCWNQSLGQRKHTKGNSPETPKNIHTHHIQVCNYPGRDMFSQSVHCTIIIRSEYKI